MLHVYIFMVLSYIGDTAWNKCYSHVTLLDKMSFQNCCFDVQKAFFKFIVAIAMQNLKIYLLYNSYNNKPFAIINT